jgi:hypothetical protein
MYVPFSIDQEAPVPERSGAAGKALECRYPHFSRVAYLQVGPTTRARFYVRDAGGILTKYLLVPYDGAATLPADPTDSGWHRDGRELWLVPRGESVYLVSQANPSDVERWPLESPNYACG